MYNIYNTISDMDISNGETRRVNCPVCNGYKTFTVTNNMGSLVWNCYKVSCGTKGGKRVHLSADDIRDTLKRGSTTVTDESFVMPDYIVPHGSRKELIQWTDEWGIDADELGLLYDVKEHRVVFPVIHNGKVVDATGRALGKHLPKWKRYGNSGLPYTSGCGSVAVVVEDCVSAAVVGNDVWCGVALLGTSLSDSHKRYLSQFSTAIIALDPDALPKTLSMARELRTYVDNVNVLRLTDDLKYRNPTDFENLTNIGE